MLGSLLGQDLDGDLGGYFAGCMTAHAVRHGEQGRGHHQAVFIVIADAAHIGAASEEAGGAPAGSHYAYLTRMATSPTVTTSLLLSAVGSMTGRPLTMVPFLDPRSSMNRFCPIRLNRAWRPET